MLANGALLFDLDGTLLDTAHDIAYVLNQVRTRHHFPEIPFSVIRPKVNEGVRGMLKASGDLDETHANFSKMTEECLTLYQQRMTNTTRLFPNMEKVLDYLDSHYIPWGVVTNKPSRFTFDMLKALELETRAACIVCGDTLSKSKPHPEPILHACQLIQKSVQDSVFIGDSLVDITAGKAAGTYSIVALYGYIDKHDDPFTWHADGYIRDPIDIISWLEKR
jgi:2-phosphoglycolate phosphatase